MCGSGASVPGHEGHSTTPGAGEKKPGLHRSQVDRPKVDCAKPGEQSVHTVAPRRVLNLPPAHAWQTVDPGTLVK